MKIVAIPPDDSFADALEEIWKMIFEEIAIPPEIMRLFDDPCRRVEAERQAYWRAFWERWGQSHEVFVG